MAACRAASWALVRASTAMLDHRRPGVRDCLARSGHPRRLVGVAGVGDDRGHRPVDPAAAGGVDLAQHRLVGLAVAQHGGGDGHHLRRAAVVLVQPDDLGAPEDLGQPVQQRRVGAVEPVDGLVGVAHDEEVGLIGQQRGEQPELGRVHVLHLVDEEMAGAPADGIGECGVAGQRVGAGHDEVVEVEHASRVRSAS